MLQLCSKKKCINPPICYIKLPQKHPISSVPARKKSHTINNVSRHYTVIIMIFMMVIISKNRDHTTNGVL